MPKQIKTCRVCGATYEACNSARSGSNVFNWREVACSPECGMVYLERITASRISAKPAEAAVARPARKKKGEKPETSVDMVLIAHTDADGETPADIEITE